MRRLPLLLPLAALVAILPLLLGSWSCGVDAPFHLQSWIDASHQLRRGALYPRWTFAAAYNAGEPRFTFYPPLSWMLGGWLTLLLPITLVSPGLLWIVLTLAGLTMYRAVAPWTSPSIALISACVYLVNPFILFTMATRAACGELFAAAWCPLLLASLLAEQPSAWRIGIPLALIWLSNVPAAVLAMYLVALLAAVRLSLLWYRSRAEPLKPRMHAAAHLAALFAGGYLYGLALPAVFLVPALRERYWIRMADAYTPGMRPFDNLLPLHGLGAIRDPFLVQVGHIAFALGTLTLTALAVAWWRTRRTAPRTLNKVIHLPVAVVSLSALLMIFTPSAPLWKHLPELWVTQFPWRTLYVLGGCLGLAVAAAFSAVRLRDGLAVVISLALVVAMTSLCVPAFRHACDASDRAPAILAALEVHHTPEPTDEYVPAEADAEFLRPDNPPLWLTQDPQSFVSGTTPNTTSTDPNAPMPAVPPGAHLSATPLTFRVVSPRAAFVVVNLERYPKWRVVRNGQPVPNLVSRPDGLIAFPVPPGASRIEIRWQATADEWIGAGLSLSALLFGSVHRRWRRGTRDCAAPAPESPPSVHLH